MVFLFEYSLSFHEDKAKMGKFISYIIKIEGFDSMHKKQHLRNSMSCVLSDYFTSTRDSEDLQVFDIEGNV